MRPASLEHFYAARSLVARLTRRSAALGGALAVMAGLLTAVPSTASAADSTTDLGVSLDVYTQGGDVVAGGGKVFVALIDRIAVANSRGALTGAITDLPGAVDLALTPDDTRLYVALRDSNEVVEIDTAALTITRRIDLAAYPCPSNMSLSGDRLWVGHGGCSDWTGGVVSLDLSVSTPQPVMLVDGMHGAPLVAAAGDTLVVGDTGHSPSDLLVYDVSTTPTTMRGEIDGFTYDHGSPPDLAITPDGSTVFSAFGPPERYEGWDTTSLAKVRTYGAEPFPTFAGYPVAIAISPDGAHIAGGWLYGSSRGIALYDTGTTEKIHAQDNPAGEMVRGSLAFSGTDVFAVLREEFTDRLHLWRLAGPTLPTSTVTLTDPSAATALEPLTLTGRLTFADGSDPGTQPLAVTRRLPDETSTTLAGVTTAADGTFTITDIPQVAGEVNYDVSWEGSTSFRGSTASVTVTVAKQQPSLTLTGPVSGEAHEQLQFSGELNFGGRASGSDLSLTVLRTLLFTGNRPITTTLPAVTPSSDGSFSFSDTTTVGGRYRYTVQWAGDNATLPATATYNIIVG
ncbi:hypothetical protein ABT061_27825 [Streptosporangium sp. NPDC002544]|uniref:hypothetical protein n=1 Tax=Streptosporangium sp. NPDC002544 TaxID=3154538 RepID=UPI003334340C